MDEASRWRLRRLRPEDDDARIAERAEPTNPFLTSAYLSARRALGAELYQLVALGEEGATAACPLLLRPGRLRRVVELPTLPGVAATTALWQALAGACRQLGVDELQVNSFGADAAPIQAVGRELSRTPRRELVLDLDDEGGLAMPSANHRRNLRRAERADVRVTASREFAACTAHVALMSASLSRRRARGERVEGETEARRLATFLEHGAGQLFQAWIGDDVMSSMLVLESRSCGYYHSAGTDPEGMRQGTSHALVSAVASRLAQAGRERFNLGGADDAQEGLLRFKRGFGAREVALAAARFSLAGPARRVVLALARGMGLG